MVTLLTESIVFLEIQGEPKLNRKDTKMDNYHQVRNEMKNTTYHTTLFEQL